MPEKDTHNAMDDLLVKYLLEEASSAERGEVEQWIRADAGHQRYFEHFRLIWETSRQLSVPGAPDEEEAWQRFRSRMAQQRFSRPAPVRLLRRSMLLRVAATLLLVLAGGWLLYRLLHRPVPQMLSFSSGAQPRTDTLPDGSVVTLNRHSQISYPAGLSGSSREVRLSGEAFFEVARAEGRPFLVQAGEVSVTVLGTSFNVKSSGAATEVIVETGRVEVSRRKQSVQLAAHERVRVSGGQALQKQEQRGELYNYYRTRAFVCNNTPLGELVPALNEAYNARIEIANPALKSLPITTTFRDQPLDTILAIISQTFPQVTITQNGPRILLK
ncbi:FecR domain-containing protein [Compostibacter hankyongensis]|uniref:DUF4974 domain-containing protein n=1 Tax=Compostibacter hankyongensis TaxID=1007089 RepID=A0ABP8G557_9BACT